MKFKEYRPFGSTRSTAVRINIHLHRQVNYDDPRTMPGAEEIWSD
jgi:hypothetical protein